MYDVLYIGFCNCIYLQELIAEHTAEINKMKSSVAEMKREHTHAMEKLESDYNTKLIVEYDKYEELMDRSANLREKLLKLVLTLNVCNLVIFNNYSLNFLLNHS